MATPEQDFLARLQATFRIEADEHLKAISAGLLELEKTADPARQATLIETVFRDAHSLKGAARAVNLNQIETLCQSIEEIFAALKRGEVALTPELFDSLHHGTDALQATLIGTDDAAAAASHAAIRDVMQQLAHEHTTPVVPPAQPAAAKPAESSPPVARAPKPTSPAVPGAAPLAPSQEAAPRAPAIPEKPLIGETVRVARAKLDSLLLQTEEMLAVKLALRQRATDLRDLRRTLDPWKKAWTRILAETQLLRPSAAEDQGSLPTPQHVASTARLLEFLDWNHASFAALEARLKNLTATVEQDAHSIGGLVDGLLEDMKKAVMMPCATLLELFPRLVRDLARDQGKDVALEMRGGEVEIDRRILEEMKDPLIHLLRNCLDHGIEKPEQRARNAKPARGTITITLAQIDSATVEIVVADDGAGIDVQRVKQVAIARGVITAEAAESRGEAGLLALIFESEVSTSPLVTNLSGRGLGLAIVREKVEKLGGHVSVQTQPGRGATFCIVLPLTLATFRGILVRAADQIFVVPIASVERVIRVKRSAIKTVENRETVQYDGRPVALVRLRDTLELPRPIRQAAELPTFPALVLIWADKRIAFGIDEVLHEQEVLTKDLGRQLQRVRNISGATVLGTGKVVPILNVADLMKSAMRPGGIAGADAAKAGSTLPERRNVLVVEDSITSRMLLKNILESAGYHVKTAIDGVDAFTLLRTDAFDLVVSDVEMPRMNGFDLTARIRREKKLENLPVILVTALEAPQDKERGIDAGANAYIVKSSFDQSNLLATVRRFL